MLRALAFNVIRILSFTICHMINICESIQKNNSRFQTNFFYLLHSGKQGAVFQVVPFVLVQSCVTKNLEKSFLSWFFLLRFPIVQLNHV